MKDGKQLSVISVQHLPCFPMQNRLAESPVFFKCRTCWQNLLLFLSRIGHFLEIKPETDFKYASLLGELGGLQMVFYHVKISFIGNIFTS